MNPMPPNWRKRPERISPETTCYYEPRGSDLRVLVEVVVPVGETRNVTIGAETPNRNENK